MQGTPNSPQSPEGVCLGPSPLDPGYPAHLPWSSNPVWLLSPATTPCRSSMLALDSFGPPSTVLRAVCPSPTRFRLFLGSDVMTRTSWVWSGCGPAPSCLWGWGKRHTQEHSSWVLRRNWARNCQPVSRALSGHSNGYLLRAVLSLPYYTTTGCGPVTWPSR